MQTVLRSLLLLIPLGAIACGWDDPVSRSIGGTVAGGPGTRLAFVDHAQFPWDKACIFAPYTPGNVIQATTGVQDSTQQTHDIGARDDIDLLLFIHDGHIARSVAHPRKYGDFGPEVVAKCYTPGQAVFRVRNRPAGSWGTIGPSSQ